MMGMSMGEQARREAQMLARRRRRDQFGRGRMGASDPIMRIPDSPARRLPMRPGRMYTGGSRDFDESTGRYRSDRNPVRPAALRNRMVTRAPRRQM